MIHGAGGRFATRAIGQDVSLTVPDGAPVQAHLESIALYQDEGALELRAVFAFAMTYETYERVQDDRIFDVAYDTIAPDQGPQVFLSDRPIDLELGLVPSLAATLRGPAAGPQWATAATETLDDVLDRLLVAFEGTDAELPLTEAASFRWLRVLQAQPTTSGASVKLGLRSIHA